MRIDKVLSQLKYGSRNDAKEMLKNHQVHVNHRPVTSAKFDVDPLNDVITIDGIDVFYKDPIHIAIYKPKGYLSAHKDQLHPCIIELIKDPYHRFDYAMAGRLDLDAEGLMILTTSGSLAHQITHPKYHLEKTYEVLLDHPFIHEQALLDGVTILDGQNEPYLAKACHIESQGTCVILSIDEGKFHQVKRMFKALNYEVINLKRLSIGKLHLHPLKPGEYREFTLEELYD